MSDNVLTVPPVVDAAAGRALLRGALVRSNCADVLSRIAEACSPTMDLHLDLCEVRLVDAAGLGALRALDRRQRAHRRALSVVVSSSHIARLLELVGVEDVTHRPTRWS